MRLAALWALAVPLLAQDWAFPHKPHLERGLECQTCHAAAAESEESTDHLLPDGAICGVCHNGDTAPAIDATPLARREPRIRSYRFNHAFHLAMGDAGPLIAAALDSGDYHGKPGDARRFLDSGNACAACHRGLEESVAVTEAAHMPRMGDCIVCHTNVDNPFSCKECHLDSAELLPADHTREFAELHSTGRLGFDKLTCLPCHGRNFPCMGCH